MFVALLRGRSPVLERAHRSVRTGTHRPHTAPTWTDDASCARTANRLAVGIFRARKTVATASTIGSPTGGGFAGARHTRTGRAGNRLAPPATGGLLPDRTDAGVVGSAAPGVRFALPGRSPFAEAGTAETAVSLTELADVEATEGIWLCRRWLLRHYVFVLLLVLTMLRPGIGITGTERP